MQGAYVPGTRFHGADLQHYLNYLYASAIIVVGNQVPGIWVSVGCGHVMVSCVSPSV